ncbi:hypothetical protein G3I34_10700 [Streptomyces sp. SID8014]|nr:hypothetical protein [Streptomyces sp. SID8014]
MRPRNDQPTPGGRTSRRPAHHVEPKPTLLAVLDRAVALALPGWYLIAGCRHRTVGNVTAGHPPAQGAKDHGPRPPPPSGPSHGAEERVLRAGREAFAGIPAEAGIRGHARVHLRCTRGSGVPARRAPPPRRPSTPSPPPPAASARPGPDAHGRVHAPHGLAGVLGLLLRPDPPPAPREVHETKAARWREEWPGPPLVPWEAG